MSKELDILREEFKANYKKYIIATTGTWTRENEEAMQREIDEIEGKSVSSAVIVVGAVVALIGATTILLLRILGVI